MRNKNETHFAIVHVTQKVIFHYKLQFVFFLYTILSTCESEKLLLFQMNRVQYSAYCFIFILQGVILWVILSKKFCMNRCWITNRYTAIRILKDVYEWNQRFYSTCVSPYCRNNRKVMRENQKAKMPTMS